MGTTRPGWQDRLTCYIKLVIVSWFTTGYGTAVQLVGATDGTALSQRLPHPAAFPVDLTPATYLTTVARRAISEECEASAKAGSKL